jgi:cation diffusion facilitator CzcD-associated flavoprotein CzcO
MSKRRHVDSDNRVDVVVVGAGFAGMYCIHRARQAGFTVQCVERASDVGGTWYWNRYPGARCDVESMEYSYDFDEQLQQDWEWTEKYSGQPEILRYAQHVADRFDLRTHIRFDTAVTSAVFDEGARRWVVTADDGYTVDAQFLVMATGCLSSATIPNIVGLDAFAGPLVHTGQWPHDGVELQGKRVGIIGTGSSGIQTIPVVAELAQHLVVFQRTAQFSIPARNEPLDPAVQAAVKADYPDFRVRNRRMFGALGSRLPKATSNAVDLSADELRAHLEVLWERGGTVFMSGFLDAMLNLDANRLVAEFVRGKIAEVVTDPAIAALLTPTGYIGCKRIVADTNYFATYNRSNVTLVDVSASGQPIARITETGVMTGDVHRDLDVLIFATGYDAMTGSLLRADIRGRGGQRLADAWADGPGNYLGLGIAGFPNLFTVTGPGSPSVLANVIIAGQQHVEWIVNAMSYLRDGGYDLIEAERDAVEAWVADVNARSERTVFSTCSSWYVGANIDGKPRVFMPRPGFPSYVDKCNDVAANNYEGFTLSRVTPS